MHRIGERIVKYLLENLKRSITPGGIGIGRGGRIILKFILKSSFSGPE